MVRGWDLVLLLPVRQVVIILTIMLLLLLARPLPHPIAATMPSWRQLTISICIGARVLTMAIVTGVVSVQR